VLNKTTGRVTASEALRGDDALAAGRCDVSYYSRQLDHAMDVTKFEEWLQTAGERKGAQLPSKVWKELKARREEKRRRHAHAWLRKD
jgi:hypothetical protein